MVGEAPAHADVQEYARTRKLPYPVLHDPTSVNAKAFGCGGSPHAFLVGRDGKVRWEGGLAPGKAEQACEAALKLALAPADAAQPGSGA